MNLSPDMHDYSPAARRVWWTVFAVGGVAIAGAVWQLSLQPAEVVLTAVAGAILAAIVALFPVHIPALRASFACADIFTFLVLLAAGVPGAMLTAAMEGFVGATSSSKRWTSRLLTPAYAAICIMVCGSILAVMRPAMARWLAEPLGLIVAMLAFGFLYFLMNVGGLRLFFAIRDGKPVRMVRWWVESHQIGLWFLASAAVAGLLYMSVEQLGWSTLLVAMPIIAMFLATYYGLDRNAEMSRRKSEFLAHMSHELRTPLNAIIGGAQVLRDGVAGPLNPKQVQWAQDIHESGEHLLAVITDILDLSRIEAGRMHLERRPVDVAAVVAGAMTLVKDAAARKSIELHSDVPPDAGAIAADERKIKQVLLNLLSNAVKFTPPGGRVTVAARRSSGGVEMIVRDNGVGIAPEDQKAVFDAFRQVGNDGAAKAMGTGLGLTLARDLVVLHGGTLELESAPGQGSVFTVRLPDQPVRGAG